ncbi:MAG: glycosyl hydrolase family 28-related protein [Kiritimatiellales bacterium]|jgi:hypothetical protein
MTVRAGRYGWVLRRLRLLTSLLILGSAQGVLAMTNLNVTSWSPITANNATPNGTADDAPAFQAALIAITNAGGGELYIPAGNYYFNSKVAIANGESLGITIRGEAGTAIYVNNTAGFIKLQFKGATTPEVTIRNLTIISLKGSATENAGTAIEVTGGGLANQRVATVSNVKMRGQMGGPQYFKRGVVVTSCYRPLIANCSFSRTTSTDMSDTSPNFYPDVGFDISDCYAAVIQECSVTGAKTAYLFDGTPARASEDGAIRNSTANYCRTGVHFHEDIGVEPTFWVTGCDITALSNGVEVINRRICNITDNVFRQLSSSCSLADVKLTNVHLGYVLRNTFPGALTGVRTNVVVDAASLDVIIKGNTWGSRGKSVQLPANFVARRIECQN